MGVADVERPRVAAALLAKLRRKLGTMPRGPDREALAEKVAALRDEVASYISAGLLPAKALEAP